MESLEVVGRIGRETQGEAPVVQLVTRRTEHAAAEFFRGLAVCTPDLVPHDVVHLSVGGARHYDLGRRTCVDPPEYGAGGGSVFARPVTSDNGDSPGAGNRPQNLDLFVVGFLSQHLLDESDRVREPIIRRPAAGRTSKTSVGRFCFRHRCL